jgi:hypothetical protein
MAVLAMCPGLRVTEKANFSALILGLTVPRAAQPSTTTSRAPYHISAFKSEVKPGDGTMDSEISLH